MSLNDLMRSIRQTSSTLFVIGEMPSYLKRSGFMEKEAGASRHYRPGFRTPTCPNEKGRQHIAGVLNKSRPEWSLIGCALMTRPPPSSGLKSRFCVYAWSFKYRFFVSQAPRLVVGWDSSSFGIVAILCAFMALAISNKFEPGIDVQPSCA